MLTSADLAGNWVLSESGPSKSTANLANVLVFDPKFDDALGELPEGFAWIVGSRAGQYGYDSYVDGVYHGAFTYHFTDALNDSRKKGGGR